MALTFKKLQQKIDLYHSRLSFHAAQLEQEQTQPGCLECGAFDHATEFHQNEEPDQEFPGPASCTKCGAYDHVTARHREKDQS